MPQTDAQTAMALAIASQDCSFLLTHLVRQNAGKSDQDARNDLLSILNISNVASSPMLRSSITGWYGSTSSNVYDPSSCSFIAAPAPKAVCLTESTFAGLKAHRDAFDAKYGLSFSRDHLLTRGANPCLNIKEQILKKETYMPGEIYPRRVYNFIPQELHPFINIIHDRYDSTHEREWRYPGNLEFTYEELVVVYCPQEDFAAFATIQNNGFPLLFDLKWLGWM